MEKYFGLQPLDKPGPTLAILRDEQGFVLTLSNFAWAAAMAYPADFHLGFRQESAAAIDALHQRLLAGCFAADAPRKFHGSWTFYLRAPGGILVEVLADV